MVKSSRRALIWVVLIFAAGVLFGTALTLTILRPFRAQGRAVDRPLRVEQSERRRPFRQQQEKRILQRMLSVLELDAEQERAVRQIIEESRRKQQAAENTKSRELRQIRRQTLREIRALLRPHQQERLEEFLQRLRQRHRDRRKNQQE